MIKKKTRTKQYKGRTNITKEKKFTMKFSIDDERNPGNGHRLAK